MGNVFAWQFLQVLFESSAIAMPQNEARMSELIAELFGYDSSNEHIEFPCKFLLLDAR